MLTNPVLEIVYWSIENLSVHFNIKIRAHIGIETSSNIFLFRRQNLLKQIAI